MTHHTAGAGPQTETARPKGAARTQTPPRAMAATRAAAKDARRRCAEAPRPVCSDAEATLRRHLRRRCAEAPRAMAAALAAILCLTMTLAGCGATGSDGAGTPAPSVTGSMSADGKTQTFAPASGAAAHTLVIASGSENKEAADAIQHAVDSAGVAVEMHYMGSLDIMNALRSGADGYDAVWPASSMWISMGDTGHIVRNAQSTSTTPVVFGVRRSKAQELGWASSDGSAQSVSTSDIIDAVSAGSLSFSMTSATQSNSGASAYLAFLTALAGTNAALTDADLSDTATTGRVKDLLLGVDRSSGSSDWLKDMMVEQPDAHDAMVNYESMVIAADKELEAKGAEPLIAIYPSDGIAVSDSPLGYVDRGQGDGTLDAFKSFQSALADDEATLALERAGRRCGLGGKVKNASDEQVAQAFRADWGISTDADALRTIALPDAAVVTHALDLYQRQLRKPSYTVWVVDYSGSMNSGGGKTGVVAGLQAALDPAKAAEAMIEPADGDVNVFIPFSDAPGPAITAEGTDTVALLQAAEDTKADGGTDIYRALEEALTYTAGAVQEGGFTVAIVLMTDGQSKKTDQASFSTKYSSEGENVPIFPIMFGQADSSQLDGLATMSNGKVFDGREGDLADVFRQVKGYN